MKLPLSAHLLLYMIRIVGKPMTLTMKINRFLWILSTAIIALTAISANATAILLDEWDAGSSGDDAEYNHVIQVIEDYNEDYEPDLPALPGEYLEKTTVIAGFGIPNDEGEILTIEWTAPNDYDYYYILTKWGKGQADFDTALHFLLAGDELNYNANDFDYQLKGNQTEYPPMGLSHVWIWGGNNPPSVPDGGTTITLLGLALAGLGLVRRK